MFHFSPERKAQPLFLKGKDNTILFTFVLFILTWLLLTPVAYDSLVQSLILDSRPSS